MDDINCYKCAKEISAEHKVCPHCRAENNALYRLLYKIENNRWYLILLVLVAVALLGVAWFLRIETGHKWIIYVVIILMAPLIPWILKTAYKIAGPVEHDEK